MLRTELGVKALGEFGTVRGITDLGQISWGGWGYPPHTHSTPLPHMQEAELRPAGKGGHTLSRPVLENQLLSGPNLLLSPLLSPPFLSPKLIGDPGQE